MWAETSTNKIDGGEDDNITMMKVIMLMIIMMAMALKRKTKNKRNGEYTHGDHINEEDDDYNHTSKLMMMMTDFKYFFAKVFLEVESSDSL